MNSITPDTCSGDCRCLARRILRRQFFVDRKFQLAMVANMMLAGLVCMLLMAMAMSWFYIYFLNTRLWAEIDTMFWLKASIIGGSMLAGIAIWTILRTHAIAGPVCKIRRVLQAAARGEIPDEPVRFRKGDAFQELADDVNRCLDIMRRLQAEQGRRQQ